MPTQITFNDGAAATLKNGKPAPGDRFSAWEVASEPIGDEANNQANAVLTKIRLRTDYGARFELRNIPTKLTGGVRLVDIADRLCVHLKNGGTCSVETGDVDGNTYATCGLMPGTR